jgi:transcriptional regulator of PTS gene
MKIVNQQLIKDVNLKNLYNLIHSNDGISRAQLAKLTDLSKTTVSALVDELINRNFIYDSGTSETDSVGRKPNSLHIKPNNYYVINMVWIDNTVDVFLMDIAGKNVYEEHMELKERDTYITLSRKCVYESILSKVTKDRILGICVVVSAMIDTRRNIFYSTTLNISEAGQASLIHDLKTEFRDFPVALLNDTACYAYAEKIYAKVEETDFAFINFSQGIGATLFLDNEMVGHAGGASTQFGHYSVNHEGKLCVCGNRGCLEATMGEPALKDRVTETGHSIFLSDLEEVTFADLGKAAKQGDIIAQTVIKSMAKELSYALSNLISTIDPKLIILGGESKKLGYLFLDEINLNLKSIGFRKMVENVKVCYSKLEQDAYMIGAMKYFFDKYYKFGEDISTSLFIG